MKTNPKILIVDDEESYRNTLKLMLELSSFSVIEAGCGKEAIEKLIDKPDAILLDLVLPDMYGIEVLKIITAKTDIPVIVISAKDGWEDIDSAISGGAADYIIKPNKNDGELIVKLNHLINKQRKPGSTGLITIGNISIDIINKIVKVNNIRIHFSDIEYRLIELLAKNPNKLLDIETIKKEIWGDNYEIDESYVRKYIQKIREKIGDNSSKPMIIVTEHGRGYILEK